METIGAIALASGAVSVKLELRIIVPIRYDYQSVSLYHNHMIRGNLRETGLYIEAGHYSKPSTNGKVHIIEK